MVAGSNPARGANKFNTLLTNCILRHRLEFLGPTSGPLLNPLNYSAARAVWRAPIQPNFALGGILRRRNRD
jgi:hypothetical protein